MTMSTALLTRLLGRKKITSTSIGTEIERQETALTEAHARTNSAERAGVAAVEAGDKGALSADALKIDAAQDIRLIEHALSVLRVELRKLIAIEEREEFQRQVAAHTAAAEAIAARIGRDYGMAAKTIASLVADLQSYNARADELRQKGKDFGEAITLPDPEAFRHGPQQWSVRYRHPDGDKSIQCNATDAPLDVVKWVDGKPVAAREDAEIYTRGREYAGSLTAIGTLPAVHAGDPSIHSAPEEPIRFSNAPM